MNVRTKMLSLLALLFVILIVIDIAIQKEILMPSFAELERDDARDVHEAHQLRARYDAWMNWS